MFEKTKAQLQPVADIPRNVQITMVLSLLTLAVCLATLAMLAKGVR